jgi:hypothetical protein
VLDPFSTQLKKPYHKNLAPLAARAVFLRQFSLLLLPLKTLYFDPEKSIF